MNTTNTNELILDFRDIDGNDAVPDLKISEDLLWSVNTIQNCQGGQTKKCYFVHYERTTYRGSS